MRNWHDNKSPFGRWHTAGNAVPPATDFGALMSTLLSGTTGWATDTASTSFNFTDTAGTIPVSVANTDTVGRSNSQYGTTALNWQAAGTTAPLWTGGSWQHDGTDDALLNTSQAFSSGVTGTTFTVRFRCDSLAINRCILSYGTATTTSIRFRLQVATTGALEVALRRLDADAGATISSTTGIITAGVTYTAQVTVNYLDGSVAFYLNGSAVGTGTYPGTDGITGVSATSSARVRWGVNNTNTLNDYFLGRIGLAVWAPSVLGSTDLANCRGYVERSGL